MTARCRNGMAQVPGNPTSPARGSLLPAPMREVQSAKADFVPFQRRVSNPSSQPPAATDEPERRRARAGSGAIGNPR